ncbi:bifunctional 3'-5' exonuclease/DNA polymerase [Planctomonas psychrotolerans]|uniref:bifunctional 3'-5' exonuclease/DNA polymerase n=1 Tax=Planctomonas psychrotolerans TaxID=2528712 RepID=UPI00123BD3E2|nr:bifunctional 3'-5' exonuclease/DNA polymerase [Planctomonas psychrotolerans]
MYAVLTATPNGARIDVVDADGAAVDGSRSMRRLEIPAAVSELERASRPRWVWDSTARWYPELLRAGIRVDRCHDLRLCHTILRSSELTADSVLARAAAGEWDVPLDDVQPSTGPADSATLFDLLAVDSPPGEDEPGTAVADELRAQLAAVAGAEAPGRIRLLLAAESAGALSAAEMSFDGLPFDAAIHDRVLTELLGSRPRDGDRPERLEALADVVRRTLDSPDLHPDSPAELLRALRRAGVPATSTRQWELKSIDHPAIPPLLEYKKLSRLLSANGWTWMDTWIREGRFHPEYVPGGVVTGRWAAKGGGALQLPGQVRGAVVADPGWKLVVADAAQLEPRVLAALSGDDAMASAGRGKDLYQGLVDRGVVDTRASAKVAMLGAMYGATQGQAGRLMPRLAKAYPQAIGMVENAARAGEQGKQVTTRLGRSSPLPGEAWLAAQADARAEDAGDAARARARSAARDWGRFTRNFIVQGSAAEWALCWMAHLRSSLRELGGGPTGPHLVFFLHDEVMVHTPEATADAVRDAVHAAAAAAGRSLFGTFPVDFPVTTAIVDSYADAK